MAKAASSLVFNSLTERSLQALATRKAQSVLVTGKKGSGISSAARHYALSLTKTPLTIRPQKDGTDDPNGSIGVERIRELYTQTSTRAHSGRVIIIEDAHAMGIPAQNAFLKLLEEPGENTHFILATHSPQTLLPTIRSRVQTLEIKPITLVQSEALLDTLSVTDTTKRSQLLFIASGLPGLLTNLANDEKAFNARAGIIRDARSLIQDTPYNRLAIIQKYKDDRPGAVALVEDCIKLLSRNVESSLPKLEALLNTHARLLQNGNIRLQLASVMV